jgi:hypothetical protein
MKPVLRTFLISKSAVRASLQLTKHEALSGLPTLMQVVINNLQSGRTPMSKMRKRVFQGGIDCVQQMFATDATERSPKNICEQGNHHRTSMGTPNATK